jgi:hypothetical protein
LVTEAAVLLLVAAVTLLREHLPGPTIDDVSNEPVPAAVL